MTLRSMVLSGICACLSVASVAAGSVDEQGQLLAFDGNESDKFGLSVAVDGDRVLVGAPGADIGTAIFAGAAYTFVRTGGTWSFEDQLVAPVPAVFDSLGFAVALDGDTALVGTPQDEAGAPNSGSAYVFVRQGNQWVLQAQLAASDPGQMDRFGHTVALDGDVAIVGSPWNDDDGDSSGAAYVFTRNGTVWSQEAKLTASDAAEDAWFGDAVDLDGDNAVVGAPFTGGKAAYVFKRSGSSWSEQAKLVDEELGETNFFGTTVAISGNTVLVGGPLGSVGTSFVSVFVRSQGVWSLDTRLFPLDDLNDFGASVGLDGNLAVVGATGGSGTAWYFTREAGSWSTGALLVPDGPSSLDEYGAAVAVDGGTVVIGAPESDDVDDDAGAAWVFELPDIPGAEVPAVGVGGAILLVALLGGSSLYLRRRERAGGRSTN